MTPLRIIRRDLGYRTVDVAALAGVAIQTVRKIERMDEGVRLGCVIRVASALGVGASDLYPALDGRIARTERTAARGVR